MFYELGIVCLIILVGRLLFSWWEGEGRRVFEPLPEDRWPFGDRPQRTVETDVRPHRRQPPAFRGRRWAQVSMLADVRRGQSVEEVAGRWCVSPDYVRKLANGPPS